MKLFVPLLAAAAVTVCIGGRGVAWSQTSSESDSQTTTTTAPSVTQKKRLRLPFRAIPKQPPLRLMTRTRTRNPPLWKNTMTPAPHMGQTATP